jgi:hypothetical protein
MKITSEHVIAFIIGALVAFGTYRVYQKATLHSMLPEILFPIPPESCLKITEGIMSGERLCIFGSPPYGQTITFPCIGWFEPPSKEFYFKIHITPGCTTMECFKDLSNQRIWIEICGQAVGGCSRFCNYP